VADDTVGDEVTGPGRDVEQRQLGAEWLDGGHPAPGVAQDRVVAASTPRTTHAEQRVVPGQVGPRRRSSLGPGDVLPPPIGEEPVVGAGDQLAPVREGDAVGRLHGRPVVDDSGGGEAPAGAAAHRPEHGVARPHVGERLVAAVGHEHRCVPRQAVRARVGAAAVGVDRVAEPEGRAPDVVDDALGPHMEELDAPELAASRLPLEHRLLEQGPLGLRPIGPVPSQLCHGGSV
jgi:hypothetical protein